MYVLGLGGSNHDFSACIVRNGEIKCAVEEERLCGIKRSIGFNPMLGTSAAYCMDIEGIRDDQIDAIYGNDILIAAAYFKYRKNIKLINHHLAHAASAYYPSAFQEAAIIVVDGYGSVLENDLYETTSLYYAEGTKLNLLKKISGQRITRGRTENSLGNFYAVVTECLGYGHFDAGKTMGMAPYGKPVYMDIFNKYIYMIDRNNFTFHHIEKFEKELMDIIQKEDTFQTRADISATTQKVFEEIYVALAQWLKEETGSKHLCIAGGAALNSVANGIVHYKGWYDNQFVQPAASDSGTAIGSALYGYYELSGNNLHTPKMISAYLGKEYSNNEIEKSLQNHSEHIHYEKNNDVINITAQHLKQGCIVGWFTGGSEIGPRALGHRSIITAPFPKDMKDCLNERVKHREWFRPFAPVVLDEHREEYFMLNCSSPFMLLIGEVKKDKADDIAATVHIDGTARVQTVTKEANGRFYELVEAFERITGIPVILNTSFNDNGKPIVETPNDAISCFLNTQMDLLVIEDYIIKKRTGTSL